MLCFKVCAENKYGIRTIPEDDPVFGDVNEALKRAVDFKVKHPKQRVWLELTDMSDLAAENELDYLFKVEEYLVFCWKDGEINHQWSRFVDIQAAKMFATQMKKDGWNTKIGWR